jgi:hypothetical protein
MNLQHTAFFADQQDCLGLVIFVGTSSSGNSMPKQLLYKL